MGNLWSQFLNHTGRPMQKWSRYFPAYEQHFGRYVGRPVRMLEIGVADGGSLQMWREWLGPEAQIVGLDIVDCTWMTEPQVDIFVGSQDDPDVLQRIIDKWGPFDIVLDDGSHRMDHVSDTFHWLYYKGMAHNGVYAVEDMHTAYYPHMVGDRPQQRSFIEIAKDYIDELNGQHNDDVTTFTQTTTSIHFYDSMVFFERGQPGPNRNIMYGYGG